MSDLRPHSECPVCHQAFNFDQVTIHDNRVLFRGKTVELRPQLAAMLGVFAERVAQRVTYNELFDRVWGAHSRVKPNIVSVQMCFLRKAIKPLGLEIINDWGKGWRLITPL